MIKQDEIREEIESIIVPGVMQPLSRTNLIRKLDIGDHTISLEIANAALSIDTQEWLKSQVIKIANSKEIIDPQISFLPALPKEINQVKNIIAIMSGKGGVGKSLVTGLTAVALARKGYAVGILDADITGPSIPRIFGISQRPSGSDNGLLPVSTRTNIEIMSINLLLQQEDDAVIWRGPLIGKAITQFWEEVLWGKLDCLLVDLPPGTADAPLSVMQVLPVTGVIIVFTPQDLTAMIVKKAVKMTRQMKKNVLGLVENMSYLYIPEINRKIEIFGPSRAKEMEEASGASLLASLPIDPELAKLCDSGQLERYNSPEVEGLGEKIIKALNL